MQILRRVKPDIHVALCAVRDDIVGRATLDNAKIHTVAVIPALRVGKAADPLCQLDHGAGAVIRIDARMGRFTMQLDAETADTLARLDVAAVAASGFQIKAVGGMRGELADPGVGTWRADLLIAVVRNAELEFRPLRLNKGCKTGAQQRAGFHIRGARAEHAVAVHGKRAFSRRPHWKHRIHVADQKKIDFLAFGMVARFNTRAEIGAERFLFRPHTEISVLFHHEIGDLVDAFDSAGTAVSVDKNCQILQKGAFIIIWIHSLPLLSCAAVRQQKRRRGNIIPTFPLQQKLRDVGQLFDRKRIAHSQK